MASIASKCEADENKTNEVSRTPSARGIRTGLFYDLEARRGASRFPSRGRRFPTGTPSREELLPYKLITFNQK